MNELGFAAPQFLGLWMDEIPSRHCETMVETMVCWYLQGNHQKPSERSGGAKWISQPSAVNHSNVDPILIN